MAVNLSPYGGVGAQFLDNSGNVLTGGKIFTYAGGTTTPQATYTSSNGATPHPNPIILDAAGRVPGGEIWLTDGLVYKFILRDANDVLIATYDGISGINSNFVAFTNQQEIQTATAGQTVFNLTTMSYQPGTNSLSVFVDGVNQYGPGAQYAYLETDSDTVTFLSGLHVGAEVKFTTSQLNTSGSTNDAFQVSYVPPYTNSVATNVGDKLAQTVSVKDFGAVGDGVTDDTVAFFNALTNGFNVYVPEGTYLVGASNSTGCRITSGNGYHLFGDGEKSIIKRVSYDPENANIIFDSGSASTFIDDVKISNLKFLGDVASLGHNELYGHMIRMGGVRRVLIEKCYFEGPRSDALLIDSGPGGPLSERHNFDVTIRDCVFNGVIYGVDGGRNAISVIDVDGMLIEGNSFRDWSRNDMPGTIDFEPNYSFGVIKNVRVVNNKFTNTAGLNGHVVFACDNIPTANQQNWVVTGNEFTGATGTSGAAIYILTEQTTPSVPNTNGQNIVISNNTATNCNWFVDKFRGSVNGITIASNVINFSGTTQGAIRFADGTANYTLTDAIISNNSFVTTNNIPVAISDNIVNLVFSNNIMRGATQAHTRWGLAGSSTTNISMLNNVFLGTPTNGDCQYDAGTTNSITNVYLGNIAPAGQSTRFRAFKTDNAGNNSNQYNETALPNSFPRGISTTRLSSRPVIGVADSGMIYTFRQSDTAETVYQVFVIEYSVTALDDIYFRKAINATTWAAWYRVTGV